MSREVGITLKVDPRVARAGMLGARLKEPRHAGRTIATQTPPIKISKSRHTRSHSTQTMGNNVVHQGTQVSAAGPAKASAGTQTHEKHVPNLYTTM